MRGIVLTCALGLGLLALGCGPSKPFDGPTVDRFEGQLTHNGKPVSFAEGEKVELKLFHEKGQSFGIPIKADGSFTIGWMPTGKYSAMLRRERPNARGGPSIYTVPGGLTIQEGQADYRVELGKGWKG